MSVLTRTGHFVIPGLIWAEAENTDTSSFIAGRCLALIRTLDLGN